MQGSSNAVLASVDVERDDVDAIVAELAAAPSAWPPIHVLAALRRVRCARISAETVERDRGARVRVTLADRRGHLAAAERPSYDDALVAAIELVFFDKMEIRGMDGRRRVLRGRAW